MLKESKFDHESGHQPNEDGASRIACCERICVATKRDSRVYDLVSRSVKPSLVFVRAYTRTHLGLPRSALWK